MTDENDWQAAYRILAEREYARNAEPPTAEQIEDCFLGKLPDDEADRIRERLAYYPDLVRVMATSLPDAAPDELSETALADDWARLRKSVETPPETEDPPLVPFPVRPAPASMPFIYAAAAVIAVALAGIYLWSVADRAHPTSELPKVARILLPDGQRGGGQLPIPLPAASQFDLRLVLHQPLGERKYRVLIKELGTNERLLWQEDSLARSADGSLPLVVSSEILAEGPYRIELYGADAPAARPLATYTLSISKASGQ